MRVCGSENVKIGVEKFEILSFNMPANDKLFHYRNVYCDVVYLYKYRWGYTQRDEITFIKFWESGGQIGPK